jgi:hypothetical protein
LSSLAGDLFPPAGRYSFRPRLAALPAERNGGRVLLLMLGGRHVVGNVAGRDPHDVDGVADRVARTALAFGASLASLKLVLNVLLKLSEQPF